MDLAYLARQALETEQGRGFVTLNAPKRDYNTYVIPAMEEYDPDDEKYPYTKELNFKASPENPWVNLFTCDEHVPFHDPKCMELVLKFREWLKPNAHIRLGDWNDFWGLSRFRKDPRRMVKYNIQSELNCSKKILNQQHESSPETEEFLLEGNHDLRLQKALWDDKKEFAFLDCLSLPRLLELDKINARYCSYDDGLTINGIFYARHGEMVRKYAGYTAKAHMEKHGGNGIHGHSHRLAHYTKRNRSGLWGWAENGCLCTLNPEYISYPDWQQGFTVQTWFSEHQYLLEQIHIINYRFIYQGKVFD